MCEELAGKTPRLPKVLIMLALDVCIFNQSVPGYTTKSTHLIATDPNIIPLPSGLPVQAEGACWSPQRWPQDRAPEEIQGAQLNVHCR